MKPDIRDFTADDRERYCAMSREFYTSGAVLHPIPEEHFQRTFQACMDKSPYLRGLMLWVDGEAAGYALLSLTWSNEAGGLSVLLEEASILPPYQGKGLGTAFLEFVEREYKDTAKRLRLEVTRTNEGAIRLYKRFGYEPFDYLQMIKDFQ